MSLRARIARLERRQEQQREANAITPHRLSLEWWKWRTSRRPGRGEYAPKLPPGMTIEGLDEREREKERRRIATPEGAAWAVMCAEAVAQVDSMDEP